LIPAQERGMVPQEEWQCRASTKYFNINIGMQFSFNNEKVQLANIKVKAKKITTKSFVKFLSYPYIVRSNFIFHFLFLLSNKYFVLVIEGLQNVC